MSLSELLNPSIGSKYWMNTYHNTVHTNGMQFGSSSTQGYVLGAIDSTGNIGLIPSGGTGGAGGVTNTDSSIVVTQTASGGASVQATGNFSAGSNTVLGKFSALNQPGAIPLITGSTALSPTQVLGGFLEFLSAGATGTLTLPNGTGVNSIDSNLPSGYAVNGNGFYFLIANDNTSTGTIVMANNASFQCAQTLPLTIPANSSRMFYAVRSGGNWVLV